MGFLVVFPLGIRRNKVLKYTLEIQKANIHARSKHDHIPVFRILQISRPCRNEYSYMFYTHLVSISNFFEKNTFNNDVRSERHCLMASDTCF